MHLTMMIVKTTNNTNGDNEFDINNFVNYAFDIIMITDSGDITTSTTKYRQFDSSNNFVDDD